MGQSKSGWKSMSFLWEFAGNSTLSNAIALAKNRSFLLTDNLTKSWKQWTTECFKSYQHSAKLDSAMEGKYEDILSNDEITKPWPLAHHIRWLEWYRRWLIYNIKMSQGLEPSRIPWGLERHLSWRAHNIISQSRAIEQNQSILQYVPLHRH